VSDGGGSLASVVSKGPRGAGGGGFRGDVCFAEELSADREFGINGLDNRAFNSDFRGPENS
jgi:hypothetical protein